jgi:4-methyl-5(b-hydroxyethyl)-thiazole monophosphate biosynthesis
MKKTLLLLAKGFESFEASAFVDVLTWNLIDGDHETEIVTCGIDKVITSTGNIKVSVDITIDEVDVDAFDALAIPGGFEECGFYDDSYQDVFLELIREFNRKNKIIASICVGALPLGKSGILVARNATTYNMKDGIRQTQLKEYGVNIINEPIVIDKNIITSWNPSTALNVALKLLELLTTKEKSDFIKNIMGF